MLSGQEEEVYRLRKFFVAHFQKDFVRGEYIKWSFEKPFGYVGDYKIIDDIYLNSPRTTGFDRLFDNFFMQSPASVATRNRKEDFKQIIHRTIFNRNSRSAIHILDLAAGPGRDLLELLTSHGSNLNHAKFHCYENDQRAIDHARTLLKDYNNVFFIKENVVRLALRKDIERFIPQRFDLIFSTGLFDYLEDKVSIRLISNLRKLMKPDGVMVISNYRDKYSNPSLHFMEWVGEWNLVYRTEDEFSQVFEKSNFSRNHLTFEYEQQGIMQYCFARNTGQ
jgi:SAM-dependent methyltransferase